MTVNRALMPEAFDAEDEKYEEEWKVIMSTRGEYFLSKVQARVLQQAIATGNRGVIMFKTFSISIPYVAEFYRVRRYLKEAKQLPSRASEAEYKPVDPKVFAEWRKRAYAKIGKRVPKGR